MRIGWDAFGICSTSRCRWTQGSSCLAVRRAGRQGREKGAKEKARRRGRKGRWTARAEVARTAQLSSNSTRTASQGGELTYDERRWCLLVAYRGCLLSKRSRPARNRGCRVAAAQRGGLCAMPPMMRDCRLGRDAPRYCVGPPAASAGLIRMASSREQA